MTDERRTELARLEDEERALSARRALLYDRINPRWSGRVHVADRRAGSRAAAPRPTIEAHPVLTAALLAAKRAKKPAARIAPVA